jgi:hypothetical protein
MYPSSWGKKELIVFHSTWVYQRAHDKNAKDTCFLGVQQGKL